MTTWFVAIAAGTAIMAWQSSHLVARLSGWRKLAGRWRARNAFEGFKMHFCEGYLR